MKAYKATKNSKCINITYETNKTYTFKGKMENMWNKVFHFCKELKHLDDYYKLNNKDTIVYEIDILGEELTRDNKSVTNKFKIIRKVNKKEYPSLSNNYIDTNGNLIKHEK